MKDILKFYFYPSKYRIERIFEKTAKQKRRELECFINSLFDIKSKDTDSIDEEFIRKIIDFITISKDRKVIIHFKFDIVEEMELLGGLGYE